MGKKKGNKLWDTVKGTLQKNKARIADLAIMTGIISVVVLIAYQVNGIYPFGEETIARGDMVQQTIPAGMYYMWDVLHGQASPFFTWNSAFGMNISGASSLGAFLSPLNLFLYLTPRDHIVYFVNILLILKMSAIAYSMYFYLRKYDVNRIVHMLGGVLYAFGAASLIHFQIMFVMDSAFLLPLIMIGIDRIFQKKGCKFFIFMFALSMIVNVYTGCITLIFVFLSCGLRNLGDVRDKEEQRRCALWLGVSVVTGAALSAVVSIPALLCIGNTSRTATGGFLNTYVMAIQSKWASYDWKTVERMIINIALPFASIVFFLLRRNGNTTVKETLKKYRSRLLLVGLLLLSVAIPGTELLWHGGSRALWPVRFVFVISFAIIDLAVALYHENKDDLAQIGTRINKMVSFVTAGVCAVISGLIFYQIYESYCESDAYAEIGDGLLCIFIELFLFGLYWCLLRSKLKELILALLCVELVCTSIISFAPNKDNVTVFSAEYLEAANNVGKSMETEIGDFERIKNTDYVVDHIEYSLVLGAESISNYWHVISPSLQANFAALGYSINWTQLLDTGGTVFTDTLFQNKYFLSESDLSEELYEYCEDVEGYDKEELQLYRNKFELPFAIMTDIPKLAAVGELFETQNQLFVALTGAQTRLIDDVSDQVSNGLFDVDIDNKKKILYFYGTNTGDAPVSIAVNGATMVIPASASRENVSYPADFGNGLICLGVFQNEHVTVQFYGSADASSIHLGLLDYDTFVNGIEQVKKENAKVTSVKQKNTGVKIELEDVTKHNIFLPVSYDGGWVCKVNGKVTEPAYMDGMMSIPVETARAMTIELTYVPKGKMAGAVISVCVCLALAAVVWLSRKEKFRQEKMVRYAGYVAYVVFVVLFLVFLVLLFDIPTLYRLRDVFILPQ